MPGARVRSEGPSFLGLLARPPECPLQSHFQQRYDRNLHFHWFSELRRDRQKGTSPSMKDILVAIFYGSNKLS